MRVLDVICQFLRRKLNLIAVLVGQVFTIRSKGRSAHRSIIRCLGLELRCIAVAVAGIWVTYLMMALHLLANVTA